jgi:chromate transporter
MRGMGAAAAGLVIGMVFKLMPALKGNVNGKWICAAMIALSVLGITYFRWPLFIIVVGLGGLSCLLAWIRLGTVAAVNVPADKP